MKDNQRANDLMDALAICETFARQAGFEWAEPLALGGGKGGIQGLPLAELAGHATSVNKPQDPIAEALVGRTETKVVRSTGT